MSWDLNLGQYLPYPNFCTYNPYEIDIFHKDAYFLNPFDIPIGITFWCGLRTVGVQDLSQVKIRPGHWGVIRLCQREHFLFLKAPYIVIIGVQQGFKLIPLENGHHRKQTFLITKSHSPPSLRNIAITQLQNSCVFTPTYILAEKLLDWDLPTTLIDEVAFRPTQLLNRFISRNNFLFLPCYYCSWTDKMSLALPVHI